jgi:hypothetical protein
MCQQGINCQFVHTWRWSSHRLGCKVQLYKTCDKMKYNPLFGQIDTNNNFFVSLGTWNTLLTSTIWLVLIRIAIVHSPIAYLTISSPKKTCLLLGKARYSIKQSRLDVIWQLTQVKKPGITKLVISIFMIFDVE